jgi:hypothetical protein
MLARPAEEVVVVVVEVVTDAEAEVAFAFEPVVAELEFVGAREAHIDN